MPCRVTVLQGKELDAASWWEQAGTPGGRSSDACSTHEGVFMDAPSPNSVSNGYLPQARWAQAAEPLGFPRYPACSFLAGHSGNVCRAREPLTRCTALR